VFFLANEPAIGIPVAAVIITVVLYLLCKHAPVLSIEQVQSENYENYKPNFSIPFPHKISHEAEQQFADSEARYYDGMWWGDEHPKIEEPAGIHLSRLA
jgi:hypothetical protein